MCLWCWWTARVWVLTRRFMRSFVVGQRYHVKAVVLVYCRGGLRWVERMRTRVVC
jgi:hypothetical protein